MFDPTAAQHIVVLLNKWYRRRSLPHGTTDHFYRGTRMSYNWTYRTVTGLMTVAMISLAAAAFLFLPGILQDKDGMALFAKIFATAMAIIGIYASLHAFFEFVVVTDDGLLKSDRFGRKTQMAWDEILHFNIKTDDNKVIFFGKDKFKLTLSLAYNGWQDFLEMAARRLNPAKYSVIAYTLGNVDTKPMKVRPPKRSLWKKPAVTRRPP
jgi:hypothetical protein